MADQFAGDNQPLEMSLLEAYTRLATPCFVSVSRQRPSHRMASDSIRPFNALILLFDKLAGRGNYLGSGDLCFKKCSAPAKDDVSLWFYDSMMEA